LVVSWFLSYAKEISVLKVRDAEINPALHKFAISRTGIVIDRDASAAEAILAQATRQGGGAFLAPASRAGHAPGA
jgi:hypothetical protein